MAVPPLEARSSASQSGRPAFSQPFYEERVGRGGGGRNSTVHDLLSYLDPNIGEETSPLKASLGEAHRAHHPGPKPRITIGLA